MVFRWLVQLSTSPSVHLGDIFTRIESTYSILQCDCFTENSFSRPVTNFILLLSLETSLLTRNRIDWFMANVRTKSFGRKPRRKLLVCYKTPQLVKTAFKRSEKKTWIATSQPNQKFWAASKLEMPELSFISFRKCLSFNAIFLWQYFGTCEHARPSVELEHNFFHFVVIERISGFIIQEWGLRFTCQHRECLISSLNFVPGNGRGDKVRGLVIAVGQSFLI